MSVSLPLFNPQSPEYRAVLYAGKGDVEHLKTTLEKFPSVLANRVSMLSSGDSYWTAGHYAVGGGHWKVVAFLLNRGFDWNLTSSTPKNPGGNTAARAIGNKTDSLVKIFTELSHEEAEVNIEALIELLLSDEITKARRLELLQKPELCRAFSKKVEPDQALLIMMLLMKGCFLWNKEKSPFPVLNHPNLFQWDSHLESLQGILYALQLSSTNTPEEIEAQFILKGMPTALKIALSMERGGFGNFQTKASPESRGELYREVNSAIAQNLGFIPDSAPLDIQAPGTSPIQLFCEVRENGYVRNFGILFQHRGGARVVYLEEDMKIDRFEDSDSFQAFLSDNAPLGFFSKEGRNYKINTYSYDSREVYSTPIDPLVISEDAQSYFQKASEASPASKFHTFPALLSQLMETRP